MVDKKIFFSIIIPAHNEEKIITQTLTYLKNINYSKNRYEVIVIENGSTDKTYTIAKKFQSNNIKIYSSKEKGVSKARNLGIKKASNKMDWIICLDADTYLKPEFLNKLNNYIYKHPKVTYGTTYITPNPNTIKHKLWHIYVNYGDFLFKFMHRIHIVKKIHLNKIRYDENIVSTEDLKFSKDLEKDGGKYFFMHTSNVLNSVRRWESEGYIKPYLLSFYHTFLGIFAKDKLKKQKWKTIR